MLSQAQINQVKRLLADGKTERQIQLLTGVCRQTVNRIWRGENVISKEQREQRKKAYQAVPRTPEEYAEICRAAKEAWAKNLARLRGEVA